jgi:hypothetical protein
MSMFMFIFKPTARRPFGSSTNSGFVAVTLLVIVYYLYLPTNSIAVSTWRQQSENKSIDSCSRSSGLDRVVIAVKTGATEASLKVPMQLRTSLRCAPHVYVFSDMAQKLGNVQIYDALDTIPAAVKDGNHDFDIYRKQQELKDPKKIVKTLHNFPSPGDPDDVAAWVLDKYKNNHIVEKTWASKPDMDWYFHVDADTYVFLSSLTSWLPRLDPSKESLIGSVALIDEKPFAHGRSGILLSNAATRSFAVIHNGTAAKWDYEMNNNCCGDWVLAQILSEWGMEVTPASLMLYGEGLGSICFGPDFWCQPVATLHHISPSEADRIGRFEQQRQDVNVGTPYKPASIKTTADVKVQAPVSFSELFHGLVFETIPSESLADWDSSSEDEAVANIKSMEACIAACANKIECLQSRFNGEKCALGTKNARLGEVHNPQDKNEKRWQSSWNRTRIAEWASRQKTCGEVVFPF